MYKFLFFVFLFTLVFRCSSGEDVCCQPLDSGTCFARFIRYGYDKSIGKCKKFIYGGCSGNDNNFEHLAQCQAVCETPWTTNVKADYPGTEDQ